MADRMAKARARKKFQEGFVVLDIETTRNITGKG